MDRGTRIGLSTLVTGSVAGLVSAAALAWLAAYAALALGLAAGAGTSRRLFGETRSGGVR